MTDKKITHLRPPVSFGGLLRNVPYSFNDDLTAMEFMQTIYKYLEDNYKLTNEMIEYLNDFIDKFDKNLYRTVEEVLKKWLKDGIFEGIINDVIFGWLNDNKQSTHHGYKKDIKLRLPLKFPDWQKLHDKYNGARLYPQSFTIDWSHREIFILHGATSNNTTRTRFVAVYDYDTGQYKTCFGMGEAGGEAIVIKSDCVNQVTGETERSIYVKSKNHWMGKYSFPVLPKPMTVLQPVTEYNTGLEWEFAEHNNKWVQINSNADLGGEFRKTSLDILDGGFNKIGTIQTSIESVGMNNSVYEKIMPKRQGIGLGESTLYFAIGGYTKKGTDTFYGYQGIRLLNMDGSLRSEYLMNGSKMIAKLEENGIKCDVIENEGVHVCPKGDVYTLSVHVGFENPCADKEGIIIFEEFSPKRSAIDFSDCADFYPTLNTDKMNSSLFARSGADGDYYNPLTGEKFTKISQICDFMFNTNLSQLKFYSTISQFESQYWNGKVPTGRLITISNRNNLSASITYHSQPAVGNGEIETSYYNNGTGYVENKNSSSLVSDIELVDGVTAFYKEPIRVFNSGDIKVMSGMITGVGDKTLPFKIGTIEKSFRPSFNRVMTCALNSSKVGGYAVLNVQHDGDIMLVYKSLNAETISLNGVSYY